MALYFGYGSNLCSRDWAAWCAGRGVDAEGLRFVRRGWLPDHELAFGYDSGSRGGGVLDVVRREGQATPGGLFEVNEECGSALDAKEGAPSVYQREEVVVLDEDGRAHEAFTYVVSASRRVGFVAPAPGYVETVAEGCDALGVSTTMLHAVCENATAGWEIPCVFAYGTLRTGESNHGWIERGGGAELLGLGSVRGVLHDCGAWPAMLHGEGRVVGELWRAESPGVLLRTLDTLEGFAGWGDSRSLFLRGLAQVEMESGEAVLAWTYRYSASPCEGVVIPGGDWILRARE